MSMVSMVNFQAIEQHLVLVLVWGLCGILSSTLATASTVISTQQTDTLDCDFENGFCGWKEVSKSLYNKWTRKAADDNRWRVDKKYRPFSDHTLGEGFGQFAYVSLGDKYNISPLRLDSPVVTMPEKGICFQFWYLMNGPSVADLNVYITPSKKSGNGKSTLVWTASGTRGVDWRPSRIHIQDFKGEAYITVETVVDRYHKTYPALDDFSMIYGHCPPSNTCDFEEDHFCSYTQSTSDDLDWSLSTLDTWVPKEGPKTDHTFETKLGHYAFINASTPRSSGNKAVLMTNPFLATTYSCLSFWYNMEGDSVGTLNIKLIYNGMGNDSNTILWTKSGDQGGDWLLTHVDVSSPVLYTIGFEGIIGDGDGGTIAIDDVGIKPGICPARGSCDFEEDFCTWRNNPGDDFEWEKVAPRHVGIPRHDHSLFTPFGHYLYLDPNGQRQGDLAKYLSPPLEKRTSYCLNLWYFATEKGNLTIITQDTVTNIEESVVFNKTKKENSWFPIRQTVGPCKNDFLIVIIGTISTYYSYDAEIGIDDLAIQEGACESLPTPNHTRNAFQCSEGTFISRREICDFKNDCMKGEDEQSCGYNCNFENKTTCGWSSTTKSGWYWAVESGAISSKHRDPKTDNTLGTIDGQYLNLNGDYGSKHALLRSPLLQRTAPNCELMFYFYYHNVSYRDFTVEKVMGSETLDLFSGQVTDNLATWNRVILPLGLTNVPFRINLIGKRYMDSDASVAVDDIYFRNCAYPEPHVSCTPENTFVCENKACVHPALLCNYVDDCGDGSDEGDEMCQSYHRCNFESDVCLWRQGKDQVDIDWTLDDASSNRFTEGPTFDHTTSMDFGHYMNINHRMSNRVAGDKAWLLSPVLQSSGLCTLTLYLFMNGDESHRFSVYTRSSTNGSLIPVFNRTGGGGELWMPVNVQLIRPKAFQIILEGVLGSYDDGYIAVDDIILSPRCRIVLKDQLASERTTIGVQTSPTVIEPTTTDVSSIDTSLLDCDFENGFCGWKEVSKSLYNKWTRKAADDNRWRVDKKYRPFSDHTLGEGFGQFAYVSLGYKYNISPLRLDSPVVTMPEKGICFQFWYLMNGPSVADLNVYITPSKKSGNGKSTLVWTASGTRGVDWRPSRIHIQDFKGEAYITVETVVDRYHKTYPALDDFSMIYGHCPPSNTCDFEEDHFCSYTQSTSDDLDWSLSTLDTWVPKEGPKTDHTFETKLGHYAFINASTPRSSGNKAVLMTNPFLATTYSCLSFWYNMEGDSVGTLNIKLIYNGVGNDSNTILWTKSGDQGGDWLLTHVDVSSPVLYTIGFEGIIGDGDGGTIAIDDVGIKPGICPARGSCDFEEDFCTWRNNPGDDFEWEKVAPRHVGIPRHDHSLFTPFGHYLYLDPNGQRQGDLAKYLSPPLEKRTSYCLNLWYFATEKGNLTIITQDTVTNIEESVVFNKTKKENSWFPIRQTVGPCKNDFLIVIIGTISTYYSYDAEIGIDDLAIQEGACESLPTPNHTRNAFQCSEGTFISRREICDFKNDCMKGEDEQSCGYNCNFENKTTCGWSSTTKSGWYWAVESGAISSKHRDPKTDNTLGTIDGQYLNLNGDYGSKHALLRSPLLQRTAPNCELMFYFYYHNVSYRDFTVEKVMGSETLDLFSGQVTDNLATWNRVILPLGLTNVPFRINLIGERYMDSDASVAVDDIYFRNCAYPEPHVSCTHENTFVCENKACVHPALLCNYVDDCGDGSDEGDEVCQSYHRCNFESDVCFWRQGKDIVDIVWTLDDAIGNDYTEGPTFDHTTSMDFGHYMNINHRKSNRVAGDKAWLFSPVLQSSRICTLTLYLFMNGDESHRFSVYTRSSTNGSLTPVFNRTGGGGELWMPVYVHLKRSTIFQIILEGTLGLNIDGYIAVDDIILSHGCMPSSNTLPTLKPIVTTTTLLPCGDATLWQCSDMSQCIYRFELCDFIVQCADGSDERDCGACDFESSTCGWVDRTRGRYIWDRMNTSTTDVQGKPKTDHTEARVNVGYYVIVHSKGYGYARPVLLESPILGSTEANCVLVFYYQMSTSYFGRLSLELYPKEITNYERNSGIVLWRRSKVVKTWIKQTVSIGSRAAGFRIVFRFSNIQYMKSLVGPALDDISFSSGCGAGKPSVFCAVGEFFCQISKECKPKATRCDLAKDCKHGEDEEECKQYTRSSFEQGSHTFSNYLRDSSNFWKLGQPSLFPGEAAPDRDHTFGNETGHYMYIEMAASSQVPSSIARLKGPVMYGNKEGTCHMRLFYHLNGNYKDAINVYTETREGGLLKTVWSANKEHGDEWKKTDIPLVENTLFRVIIEGVRDADYRGDIAIDDVSFTPSCVKANGHSLPPYIPMPNHGSCKQGLEFPCDGKCKSVKNWCDFKVDCLDGSDEMSCPSQCDFESGTCGWKKLPRSVNWEIAQVKTDVDHNPGTKTGSVLKTELKYQNKAILESPFFRASSHNCSFSFWFKYGGSDATLFLKLKSFDNEETLLHLEIRKPVTKWSLKTVSLPSCQENFQLFFSAISYSSQELPMLLDDFTFNGCAVVPSKDRCMPGEFRCSNGLCISRDRLCDLGNDCCDYSDEEYALCHRYRKMTFETGMGGWKQKTGYETWYRESLNSGDHTFSLPGGHFIYFRCNGETSILAHDMPQPSGTCIVRFWYRLKSSVANITMSIDPHFGEPFSVAAFPGYSKIKYHTWIRAELKIDLKEKYSLVLVGHCTISSSSGAIDVDDIVFSPGCFTQSSPPIQPTTPSTTLQPTPPSTTLQPTTPSTTLQPTTPSTNLQPTTPSTSLQPTTPSTTLQPTTQSTTLQTTTPSTTLQTTTPSTTLQPTTLQSSRSICPKKLKFQCVSDGQCISDNKHCDFNIDCVDTSDEADCNTINVCDFDKDLCGWRENESDNLYWKRGSTQDVPNEQGPLFDASGTSGSYVYIRHSSNVQQTNQVARLVSKYFQAAAAGCTIEFYYFIIGADPGTLSLDIRSGLGDVEPLWQTDMQSNSWVMAIVGVGRRFSNFSLAFVQKPRSDSFRGQVAIDKIKFSDSCRELHVEKYECKYQDRMYRCSRGACVLNSELCDGQDDCGDGSDESSQLCQGFTREDFESLAFPFGSLFQSDDLNWSVWNRSMIVPSGLLGVDHSTGSSRGHYIYIANTKGKDTAWLLSKPFRATESGKACQVRLFVLLPTEQQTIQVGYRTLGSSQLHITYTHPKGKVYGSYWQRVALNFDDVSRPYQVVFKASPGCPEGSLAIDDVTFGPHCRPVHRNVGSTTATNGDTHDQSEHSTGSVNDGEWKTPVGVVIGILVSVSLLAGVVVYMYRTGRIRGSRFGFKAFGEYPMQPVKEPVCHVNPLYMDAMSEPESSILNDEASAL